MTFFGGPRLDEKVLICDPLLTYPTSMNPRLRKLIGSLAILVYLFAYVVVAITIADRLPSNFILTLVYYAIVGTVWGLPLIPLMAWMNRTPR